MTRDRLHKGDRVVLTAEAFAPRAEGLIPAGTTGTVLAGGRWNAQVRWDAPDADGNPTVVSGELPYVTERVQRLAR